MTSRLLLCTVGGTPEPVVAALKQWAPARVRFIHTPQTKDDVEATIIPKALDEGVDLDAGRCDLTELPDSQDLELCLDHLRRLTPEVEAWSRRGTGFEVVVDFTGGTKCMSAAIAILASRWPCVFSYVGGRERTKAGVGVVVSGAELVRRQANPWDALGHQAVEDFVVLFDQHAFLAASTLAAKTKMRVTRPDRKRQLLVLEHLADALDAWDRFDHATAKDRLGKVVNVPDDLQGALGQRRADGLLFQARVLSAHLETIADSPPPSRPHVLDLLANAKRRRDEGRVDDAVARLYRAIEAAAQVALKVHDIETKAVRVERIPAPLQASLASKASDGLVPLGLQDAYKLLSEIGDPIGQRFIDAGLAGERSPLVARNHSILAHGFERVSDKVFTSLWNGALKVAEVVEADLVRVPKLGAEASP